MRRAMWSAVLAGCVLAWACTKQPSSPSTPTNAGAGSLNAAADGSTLKATAPTPQLPANGARVASQNDPVTLVIGNATMQFATGIVLSYRFEVTNTAGQVIENAVVASGTTYDLAHDRREARGRPDVSMAGTGRVSGRAGPLVGTAVLHRSGPRGLQPPRRAVRPAHDRQDDRHDRRLRQCHVGARAGHPDERRARLRRLPSCRRSSPPARCRSRSPGSIRTVRAASRGSSRCSTGRERSRPRAGTRSTCSTAAPAALPPTASPSRPSSATTPTRWRRTIALHNVFILDPSKVYLWQAFWTPISFRLVVREGGVTGPVVYDETSDATSGTTNWNPAADVRVPRDQQRRIRAVRRHARRA